MYKLKMDHMPLGYDSPFVGFRKIKYSFDWAKSYLEADMMYVSDTLYSLCGGVVYGLELSVVGHQIQVSSGVAVGNVVIVEEDDVLIAVKSNTSGDVVIAYNEHGYMYFCGDTDDIPSTYDYIILGSYEESSGTITVSDGDKDRSVRIVTKTVTSDISPTLSADETLVVTVNHISTSYVTPGHISLSSDDGDVTVELDSMESVLGTSFDVKIVNTVSLEKTPTITWTRTGLAGVI